MRRLLLSLLRSSRRMRRLLSICIISIVETFAVVALRIMVLRIVLKFAAPHASRNSKRSLTIADSTAVHESDVTIADLKVVHESDARDDPSALTEHAIARRILVVDYRIPRADTSAGERATAGILRDLCAFGFEVVSCRAIWSQHLFMRPNLADMGSK